MTIVDIAKQYAISCHRGTNHLYDGMPYDFHLTMVYEEAKKYQHLVASDRRDNFLAAAWVHDVIEDCRQTYNDVLRVTNKEVAELAYALTNEKGKNRSQRANGNYYKEMRLIDYAVLLKVCDRLANFRYSIHKGSSMADVYRKENETFILNINDGSCDEAIADLEAIANITQHPKNLK